MKYRKDRLKALNAHMASNKRGHETFDFSTFNEDFSTFNEGRITFNIHDCKTHGCYGGELPICDPKNWEFIGPFIFLKKKSSGDTWKDLQEYFKLPSDLLSFLFDPGCVLSAPWYGSFYKNGKDYPISKIDPIYWTSEMVQDWVKEGMKYIDSI